MSGIYIGACAHYSPGPISHWRPLQVIMRQLVEAVQVIHNKGVVHRDLKPENVLIQSSFDHPFVHLIDFGCANLMRTTPFTSLRGERIMATATPGVTAFTFIIKICAFVKKMCCKPQTTCLQRTLNFLNTVRAGVTSLFSAEMERFGETITKYG